ncbi:hypothetical protein KIN20_011698, partial [Parelaphostrongylus tenuis]
PDVAGGAYTKEAEEADREADDHFVDREAARGQEDYDRAAAEKSSGTNLIYTHYTSVICGYLRILDAMPFHRGIPFYFSTFLK